MKRRFVGGIAATIICLGCNNNHRDSINETTCYKADVGQSHVTWTIGRRHGSMLLQDGAFVLNNGAILADSFSIDLHTLKTENTDSATAARITDQMLGASFFDVAQFPHIVLLGSSSAKTGQSSSTGILSVKGLHQTIPFSLDIIYNSNVFSGDGAFVLKCADWNLHGDKDSDLSKPYIDIRLHLVANQAHCAAIE